MQIFHNLLLAAAMCCLFQSMMCQEKEITSVSVPMILDHNRMLVDAKIQRNDGSWRKVRLWVDSGNPTFSMSKSLARDLGIDLSAAENSAAAVTNIDAATPAGVRIGGMNLNFEHIKSKVLFQPFWLFSTMHNDANLPSTVLRKYHIILDYPGRQLTIAEPGTLTPRGIPSRAKVHPETGIIQMNTTIDGDSLGFALDNGASYSFISEDKLVKYFDRHSDWQKIAGTLGCANMWGWWPPKEELFSVVRIPEMRWGDQQLKGIGMVGVPRFSPDGPSLGEWYSRKTASPVDGFLGANAFKAFRIEIDYLNSIVYFEKGAEFDTHDMDMVGIALRQLADSNYQIIGIAKKDGKPLLEGVEPGDILFSVGELRTKGMTMGRVVDALRGKPGELRSLKLDRNGRQLQVNAKVEHWL